MPTSASRLQAIKIPSKTTSTTSTNDINSRIDEIQNAIDTERDNSAKKDEVYTKAQIDELLEEMNGKIPKIDERGNMTWIDPNGNLVVVHMGDVVIGGDDIIIVDGQLSTTSKNPIQNQAVTNALNEKQNKSTSLSFGNSDGGWSHVASSSDYIELFTNTANSKGFRIKPDMIATSLDNVENENQLITAYAVQQAINEITSSPGGGTQPYYYNLINVDARSLVTQYSYETNAPYDKIVEFAEENICDETISEKWCDLRFYPSENRFVITKRNVGYELRNYNYMQLTQTQYTLVTQYAANIPDNVNPTTYAQEFCATRGQDYCYIADIDNLFTEVGALQVNEELGPIYLIGVVSGFGNPPL